MSKIYHVAKHGSDCSAGTEAAPFLTIQRAAELAQAGDRVIVHEGVYREWVRPRNGGWGEDSRIVYEAAPGEHVTIKGSERATGWTLIEGTVWKITLKEDFFGGFNPYRNPLGGDWFVSPTQYAVHSGDVYLNGKSFYEAASLEDVLHPAKRFASPHETWDGREERILEPDQTVYQWFCETDESTTTIYANFQGADPNRELVEINVRKSCFFPERTGLNYITVRGFEMAHAAAAWAPPTAMQEGLIGPNWSKGWVIEENAMNPAVRITDEGESVWLELELPGDIPAAAPVTSEVLGAVGIAGQRFEQPDGMPLKVGQSTGIHAGENRLLVWTRQKIK